MFPRVGARSAVAVTALLAIAALLAGSRIAPAGLGPTGRPEKVLLFGLPGLTFADLHRGGLPNLDRLVEEGAVGATVVRSLGTEPSTVEGYAMLGASSRVTADAKAAEAHDTPAGVAVPGASTVVRANRSRFVSSPPGALGDALHAAGKRTAVVGNADAGATPADARRPAAVALMDSAGRVDAGRVGRDLLVADPGSPSGSRADYGRVMSEVERALSVADVVLVDAGDLDRARSAGAEPAEADAARRAGLRDADRLLGELRPALGHDILLLVVSVAPPAGQWRLTPMLASGPGVLPGHLQSPSTKRPRLVSLADVAPTVLEALGVEEPVGMAGNPLRYRPGPVRLSALVALDEASRYPLRIYSPLTYAYVLGQGLVYLGVVLSYRRLPRAGRSARRLRLAVLAVAAYPLATYLFRAVPDFWRLGVAGVGVLLAIDLCIAALAARARGHALAPLGWIFGATVGLLLVDLSTGAHLQVNSLLSYPLATAVRFTGLGNTAFAFLAAATILLAAIHVHTARRRREALVTSACLFTLVTLVDGYPGMGGDVGGILTLVPAFGLTLILLTGGRVSWRGLGLAAAATGAALALAIGVDLLRPPEARSHLGRLVSDVAAGGWGVLGTTIARKATATLRTYRSPWAWAVPVVGGYLAYVLVKARGWRRLLPPGSALRAGAVGALAAGLIGHALNDSGVVVTGVVLVCLAPFVTLLALQEEQLGERERPPAEVGSFCASS